MQKLELPLINYVYVIVKWRKLIIINFFIFCIIVAIYSLIMPKTFTSTTVLMPPESNEGQGLLGLVSNLPVGGLGFGMDLNQQAYNYLAILNSRTVAVDVIEKFDLKNRFQQNTLHETIDQLKKMKIAEIRDDGLISLSISVSTGYLSSEKEEDEIRNLVANIANFFVEKLNDFNIQLLSSQARYNRIFIEKRYEQNKQDLIEAETQLKNFQEKYDAIALPEQLQAAIKTAAEINAQIILSEVELGVYKSSVSEDHPEIQKLKTKIKELESALRKMQSDETMDESSMELFPAFSDAPELGIQLIRLTREMETQNSLYRFLIQQYEQAKIQEAKDTPTVQVLDAAVPPEFRSKPHRSFMVILSGLASIFFSLIIIAFFEFNTKVNLQNNDVTQKYNFIISNLSKDLHKLIFWKRS